MSKQEQSTTRIEAAELAQRIAHQIETGVPTLAGYRAALCATRTGPAVQMVDPYGENSGEPIRTWQEFDAWRKRAPLLTPTGKGAHN